MAISTPAQKPRGSASSTFSTGTMSSRLLGAVIRITCTMPARTSRCLSRPDLRPRARA